MTLNEYIKYNNIDCRNNFKFDLSIKNLLTDKNLIFVCKKDGTVFKDLNVAEYYIHTVIFKKFFFLCLEEIYDNIDVYNNITHIRYKKLKQIF